MRRRNYALQRMADDGFITRARGRSGARRSRSSRPAGRRGASRPRRSSSRKCASSSRTRYGAKQLYENGLSVYTTLDLKLQHAATRRSPTGLRRVDNAAASASRRNSSRAHRSTAIKHPRWTNGPMARRRRRRRRSSPASTAPRSSARAGALDVRDRPRRLRLDGQDARGAPRAGRHRAGALVDQLDANEHTPQRHARSGARRSRAPCSRIDNRTGRVLRDGRRLELRASKFNRATQAMRQLGSTLQADRLHRRHRSRLHAASARCMDAPVVFPAGAGPAALLAAQLRQEVRGPVTLRHALEESRNVPTVRLMEALGPKPVIAATRASSASRRGAAVSVDRRSARRRRRCRKSSSAFAAVPEPGRADDAVSRSRASPTARATCSRRTGRSSTKRSAPTPPS